MAKSLKGSSIEKNLRDLTFKLYSLKESKSSRSGEHRTHSVNLLKTRETQMKEFIKFLNKNNLDDGSKLNLHFNNSIVLSFLQDRVSNMTFKSQETYIRGFISTIEGLRVMGVNIPLERNIIDNYVQELKKNYTPEIKTGKSFKDVDNVVNKLYEKNFTHGLLSETLKTLALRHSEGRELILNYHKYINEDANSVSGLKGKGGRVYIPKQIPSSLIDKIKEFHQRDLKLPSKKSFANAIKEIEKNRTPHSFRYSWVKQAHEDNIHNSGMTFKESLASMSLYLNHTREEISNRYLLRV